MAAISKIDRAFERIHSGLKAQPHSGSTTRSVPSSALQKRARLSSSIVSRDSMSRADGRRVAAAMAGVVALCICTPAAAHAPPQATGIFSDVTGGVTSPSWVRTNRGVILQSGPGKSPRLLCNDAYAASLVEVAPMVAGPDGLVVASYAAGILRIAQDGCAVQPAETPLAGRSVMDLATASDGSVYWALVAPTLEQRGSVLQSLDAGRTWQEASTIDGFGSALRAAPSDAQRLYVTAQFESGSAEAPHQLLVSTDGGAEFSSNVVTLQESEVRAFVLAVDPLDPDRVLLRILPGDSSTPERLLLSEDQGGSFSEVFSALGPLVVAFDADGVWAGGRDGLFHSQDRGRSFQIVPGTPSHIGCLSPGPDALAVCGHQGLEFGVFTRAANESEFRSLLRFADVKSQVACDAEAMVSVLCEANFQDWLAEHSPQGATAGSGSRGPSSRADDGPSCSLRAPGGADRSLPAGISFALCCCLMRLLGNRLLRNLT
jgi:hypothetical protein